MPTLLRAVKWARRRALRHPAPWHGRNRPGRLRGATCLVHVDEAWAGKVGERSEEEEDQLDNAFDVRPNSRLSCQIQVTEDLDGLVVHTPSYQGR